MKGISQQCLIFALFSALLLSSSCSWISSRRSLFGDSEDEQKKKEAAPVSRAEYESLLKKYNSLQKSQRIEQAQTPSDVNNMLNNMESGNQEKLLSELKDVSPQSDSPLAETVDVFAKTQSPAPMSLSKGASTLNPDLVEGQIEQIRKASALINENKLDAGLKIVKGLEGSSVRQIAVRAKFLLGEILFKQGEYDLSMQIFEEVLTKHAFSGVVIKTLGRLIVCAEKLKVDEKKEKYYSILHDFFEQGA
ncbi:hypothetical protein OAT67_04390 [Bacteriovoracaceae bacterium]|nr:hypothetical protein [Bacteriovoracaceae bacterium]